MALLAAPPSVLPDISPSRGEIRKMLVQYPNWALRAARSTAMGGATSLHRISPLEGEMPGGAEGGILTSARWLTLHHPATIRQHRHYTTPIEP
jgi:hypothetical protein